MDRELRVVLEANESYYQAFAAGDFHIMQSIWSSTHDIAIIHPGWAPLHGRAEVMNSWRNILSGQGEAFVRCLNAVAYVMGETAMVICTERLPEIDLVATNLFVREDDGWKMVHHHAGPVPQAAREPLTGSLH